MRYIGDGSWGVSEEICSADRVSPKINLLKDFSNSKPNHVWLVTLKKTNVQDKPYSINYTSIGLDGKSQIT